MQIEELIKEASTVFKNDNSESILWDTLDKMGVTKDDEGLEILQSEDFKFGDFRKIFCDDDGHPITIARRIWRKLKNESSDSDTKVTPTTSQSTDLTPLIESLKNTSQLTDQELLKRYHELCEPSIIDELRKRVGDKNCIVFNKNKTVNFDVTLQLFRQARLVDSIPSTYKDANGSYKVYQVGVFPDVTYNVCPVTNEIMINDYSSGLGFSWEGIGLPERKFIKLMVENGIKIDLISISSIVELINDKGLDGLKDRFIKIAERYDELEELGKLPSLKTTNKKTKQKKHGDPVGPKIYYEGN